MLILNNGVPKSGTTWMQRMLVALVNPAFPSDEWRNHWKNPSVSPDRLEEYYNSGEWKSHSTLLKMHIKYEPKFAFLIDPEVRIIITYRNVCDSVVSWFHHQVRIKETTPEKKNDWLENEGRRFALSTINHRRSWEGRENALLINYEAMVADAIPSIISVMQFLGMPPDEARARELVEKTQVRVSDKSKLREGMHVRTGGLSVAREELPEEYYSQLIALQAIVEKNKFDDGVAERFLSGNLGI